jgi:hypothetical protein
MGQLVSSYCKKLKLLAAKSVHITNTDRTSSTNTTHKSLVCLVCDCFIMGSYSKIPRMSMSDIKKHSYLLGVQYYKAFYGEPLHSDLIDQYNVPGFPGMLLLKHSQYVSQGCYVVCQHCKAAMWPAHAASGIHSYIGITDYLLAFLAKYGLHCMHVLGQKLGKMIFLIICKKIKIEKTDIF